MADGSVENMQILFSDIAEGIDYIRRIAKKKPSKQSILSQLQKKEQYKNLALSCLGLLGKEIDIYLSTEKLYVKSSNRNSLFLSENVDTPTKVSQNNDYLIYDSDTIFFLLLYNFFLKEMSDLRREMKDLIRKKVTANTCQVSDINKFS